MSLWNDWINTMDPERLEAYRAQRNEYRKKYYQEYKEHEQATHKDRYQKNKDIYSEKHE